MVLPLVSALHLAAGGWRLQLHLDRWVAPSTYLATIDGQTSGPKVVVGRTVTLRVDRLSRCTPLRCGLLRQEVGNELDVTGWFEANTHGGPIAFRARQLTVVS
jgi:hypothetical protein